MPNIFITLAILHFIGDYYLQFKKLAEFKEKSLWGVIIHSIIYSVPVLISLPFVEGDKYLMWSAIMCGTHFIIDFIKFFIKPVYYSPKNDEDDKKASQHLLKIDIRYFADQFLHIVVISAISLWFLIDNSDISLKQPFLILLNIKSEILVMLFKGFAAFIVVLQPVSLTFYKIFDIDLLADSKLPPNKDDKNKNPADIKGTGAIIGFMERIIMMCLLILG